MIYRALVIFNFFFLIQQLIDVQRKNNNKEERMNEIKEWDNMREWI